MVSLLCAPRCARPYQTPIRHQFDTIFQRDIAVGRVP